MKKIFLLLALATTMIACQTEKEPYSPAAPNDDNNKQETTENKPDSTSGLDGGIIFDHEFYVAVVNEKSEDLIAKNIADIPTIRTFILLDGKKVPYIAPGAYPDYPNGYSYSKATNTAYGVLKFMHISPGTLDQSKPEQYSENRCYIQFGNEEDTIECTYWVCQGSNPASYYEEIVKLVVNGKVEYDVTDPQNPMVNHELEKLVPKQDRGYVKVIQQ